MVTNVEERPKLARYTNESFIKRAKEIHGDKFDYSVTKYVAWQKNLEILCPKHGLFLQKPCKHLIGHQCPKCAHPSEPLTSQEFIDKSKKFHGDKYDYSLVEYKNHHTKVKLICKIHGIFEILPNNHNTKSNHRGCQKCSRGRSKSQEEWLDSLNIPQDQRNLTLTINGRKIKPDAFNEKTNTIYEFYGDYYHGNPKIFDLLDRQKTADMPFWCIWKRTKEREIFLKEQGYNLIVIWESDWKKFKGIKPNKPRFTEQSKINNRKGLITLLKKITKDSNPNEDFSRFLDLP